MPRPLNEQVVVITGASSGIGRETALALGRRGASVVLAARNTTALQEVAREIERLGGRPLVVPTDVAEWAQVEHLARQAVSRFGRVDTWVNNAAVSSYGLVEKQSVGDLERVIQVNLLGYVYGVKAILPHLRRQGQGTIINVGSVLSARAVPLQAGYVAAKFGIKGFTDALRLELERERHNIQVILIMPSSINTPLFTHARSKLGVKPMPIPPIYEPRVVADAILFAAEHPGREIVCGGAGKLLEIGERLAPGLVDRYMLFRDQMVRKQRTAQPDDGRDNLDRPFEDVGSTTGEFGENSRSVSLYTRHLEPYPRRKYAAVGAAVAAAAAFVRKTGT